MGWAWLIVLLATYPWVLGADLASDALASSSLIFFVSGACVIAPCRRLRRWQSVLFAGALGFLFEARLPVPDGLLAFLLVGLAIFLSSHRSWLRTTPRMLQAAAAANTLACLCWAVGSAYQSGLGSELGVRLLPQLLFAWFAGAMAFIPVALTQNAVMDRLAVPPAPETP
mgnify:CR=1 FL=1